MVSSIRSASVPTPARRFAANLATNPRPSRPRSSPEDPFLRRVSLKHDVRNYRWSTLGGLALMTFLLASCGSKASPTASGGTSTTAVGHASTVAPTTVVTAPTSPTTTRPGSSGNPPPSSTATTAGPGSRLCTTGKLSASWPGNGNGASGVLYYTVNLTNTSGGACMTGGYPGVSAYTPAGRLITSSTSRSPGTASNLTVPPTETVHFIVGLRDNDPQHGGAPCGTTVGALHVIPPNDTSSLQVATPIAASHGGFPALCGSQIVVGPIYPGSAQ